MYTGPFLKGLLMNTKGSSSFIAASAATIAILGLVVSVDAFTGGIQRRGGGGGGGGRPSAPQRSSPPPVAHARREVVRTNNYQPRPQAPQQQAQPPRQNNNRPQQNPRQNAGQAPNFQRGGNNSRLPQGNNGQPVRLPRVPNTPQRANERKFTKTGQGRLYDNGLQLHKGQKPTLAWQRPYFPHGTVHFPYYASTYSKGHVFISPWAYFYGICPPFINPAHCHVYPPSFVFIDIPIFSGDACLGFEYTNVDNWFDHPDLATSEPGLVNAIDELSETFQNGDIDALAALISPNVSIAIYERGKYRYSMDSADFVDLTRDAIQNNHVANFNLTMLHEREPGVFSVSGSEAYTDASGETRTVWVSYVLQDFSGQWTLTQVGTSPDHVQHW